MTTLDPVTPENSDNFDRLLANRTKIAEFVNSFTSERVQRKAFEAVVSSLGLTDHAVPSAPPVDRLHIVKETPEGQQEAISDEDVTELENPTPRVGARAGTAPRRRSPSREASTSPRRDTPPSRRSSRTSRPRTTTRSSSSRAST